MEKKEAEVEAQHQVGVEAILAQQKALEAKHQDEIAAAEAKWEQRLATLQTQQLQQGVGSFSAESERKRDARERELMESMSKLTETVTQLKNKRSSICTIC